MGFALGAPASQSEGELAEHAGKARLEVSQHGFALLPLRRGPTIFRARRTGLLRRFPARVSEIGQGLTGRPQGMDR